MRRAIALITLLAALAVQPARAGVVQPELPGSITIYSLAVEDPGDYTTPATGEEQDVDGLQAVPNIDFTVTRVLDETEDVAAAQPIQGDRAYSHTETTDGEGVAEFPNLAHGVYLVHQEENPAVYLPVEDFLVSVPMTNPAGTGWIYDVSVYPKTQLAMSPGIDMFITAESNKQDPARPGDEKRFLITTDIPGDVGSARAYQVEIDPGTYFTYTGGLTLSTTDRGGEPVDLTPEDDYTVGQEGGLVTVTLTGEGLQKLAGVIAGDTGEPPLLYTDYRAVLDIPEGELPEVLGTRLTASARLHYTGGLGLTSTTAVGEAPYAYTGGLILRKEDRRTNEPLAGATFQIYANEPDAVAGENPITPPGGGTAWTVETDERGTAYFHGLLYGETGVDNEAGQTTYYLVETRAPEGYNLLREPEEVAVSAVSHLADNPVVIENRTGFTLPATGGAGTLLFTLCGLALVGTGLFLLWRRSRRKRDE